VRIFPLIQLRTLSQDRTNLLIDRFDLFIQISYSNYLVVSLDWQLIQEHPNGLAGMP
jgi:hypothetical protein